MSAKYSLKFNRKNKLNSEGKGLIQIKVYFNRKQSKFISTGLYVLPKYWDKKKDMLKSYHPQYNVYSKAVRLKLNEIKNFEDEQIKYDAPFNSKILDAFLKKQYKREKVTFNSFYEKEMNALSPKYKKRTGEAWEDALRILNEFNPEISFRDISFDLIEKFDNYMAIDKGLSINGRWGKHKNVKKFLGIAIAKDYLKMKDFPYESKTPGGKIGKFKVLSEDGEKTPLDFEELQRLSVLKYEEGSSLQKALDIYLFMCYTGLRISDAMSIELFEYLHYSSDGYSIDLMRMKKLRRQVFLKLHTLFEGRPEEIIKKYLIHEFKTDAPEVLERKISYSIFGDISYGTVQKKLKFIGHDAKIQKNLTPHTARFTFGTQMAVLTKGNINLVMELMGISRYDTAQIYIKLAENMVAPQLKKINWGEYNRPIKRSSYKTNNIPVKKAPDTNQFLSYIYNEVFKYLKNGSKDKIPIAIDKGSLSGYVEQMPFAAEYIKSLKEKPFEINGMVYGMEFANKVDKLQKQINDHQWFKSSFLRIKLMVMPFDDGIHEKVLI